MINHCNKKVLMVREKNRAEQDQVVLGSTKSVIRKRLLLSFVSVVCLLSCTATAYAFGLTQCAADRYGSNLGCTAQDVRITGIAIVPGGPTSCVGGGSVTLDLDVTLNFAKPDRYDIGVFLSSDGKDPAVTSLNGGAASCNVSILPLTSPFLNLDFDSCGDGNDTVGGAGVGVVRVTGVPVLCQAVALSGGKLYIPYLTSWDNTAGTVCTSAADPVPNTGSKCNVPDSAVEADVLRSTVALVTLPSISKTDGITTITAGNSTTYSIVITNTTGAVLSNAIFKDPLVSNLTVTSLSCSAAGGATCPSPLSIPTMQGGGITIPTMPVNSSVTFTLGTTVSAATPAGTITNTSFVIVSGETNSFSDTNNVITKFVVGKSFLPASISVGGTSVLTITLHNTNLVSATSVSFTDTYPANLLNTATPGLTNTCGGTATAAANGTSLSLSNGTISAGGSCTITVSVTSAVGGAYINSTGTVTSAEGFVGDPVSAALAVGISNLSTSTKSWQDLNGGEPNPGDVIRYTIMIPETAGVLATGVSVTDTIPATLSAMAVVSCPTGTCTVAGQTLTASGISVPANSSLAIVFDATIPLGTPAGTTINNCATITNPGGIGASPCAPSITVSPSAVASSGNKPLYLLNATSLSRSKPSGTPASVAIVKNSSQLWVLSPALTLPVTISPDVTPLAVIPVKLYLASNTASESRTVQVDVTCSGGGTTYSETKIFDGTAVNNPYLPTTPILVAFNNLTISSNHTCAAGQTWNLTVRNNTTGTGTRNVIVYPVSGGNNSYFSLPSLSIINVDSVNSYIATYPSTSTPVTGYFNGGQTVYVRAVVSDPFGSFDVTSATVTIKDPFDAALISAATMTQVADSGTSTKTYQYAYAIPPSGPAGPWSAIVTAKEGTEENVSDSGTGGFNVGMPNILVVKSSSVVSDPINGAGPVPQPRSIPGAVMEYTVIVTNSGPGAVDNNSTVLTDTVPANMTMYVFTGSGDPVTFSCSVVPGCGLAFNYGANVRYTSTFPLPALLPPPNVCGNFTYAPSGSYDANVRGACINPSGILNGSAGPPHPQFTIKYRMQLK